MFEIKICAIKMFSAIKYIIWSFDLKTSKMLDRLDEIGNFSKRLYKLMAKLYPILPQVLLKISEDEDLG